MLGHSQRREKDLASKAFHPVESEDIYLRKGLLESSNGLDVGLTQWRHGTNGLSSED